MCVYAVRYVTRWICPERIIYEMGVSLLLPRTRLTCFSSSPCETGVPLFFLFQ